MAGQDRPDEAAAKRDAVLRRMLAMPKPGKGEKKDTGAQPAASKRPAQGWKPKPESE